MTAQWYSQYSLRLCAWFVRLVSAAPLSSHAITTSISFIWCLNIIEWIHTLLPCPTRVYWTYVVADRTCSCQPFVIRQSHCPNNLHWSFLCPQSFMYGPFVSARATNECHNEVFVCSNVSGNVFPTDCLTFLYSYFLIKPHILTHTHGCLKT